MRLLALLLLISVAACSSGSAGDAGSTDAGSPPRDWSFDAPTTSCDPEGHFGTPATTLTLVPQSVSGGQIINYPDVQASFPGTDWTTLDRLYIPAGHYRSIMLQNLPTRAASRPLVITNQGGQVFVGENPTGNYIWSMGGGSNWILTGRYDAASRTGDAAFPGHACGHYAQSAGTYGFLSDDGFAFMAPYLHMGIAVGDATDFEIEYVEVERSGFAGIRLINERAAGDPPQPMANVRVHDTYVHDTGAEGFYFGWTLADPGNLFPGLQVYNNRLLRTGNEALQIQDLGDGTHVHHNTIAGGGLRWLDNGLGRYQDNLLQISSREGEIEVDHNVFLDGAGAIGSFWTQPESIDGDGPRHVRFHDDYFGDAINLPVYFGGTADGASSFDFTHDFFRDITFAYTPAQAAATDPGVVLSFSGMIAAPITLNDVTWAGTRQLVSGLVGTDGTRGHVTATGNHNEDPPAIAFVEAGYPIDEVGHHLTSWAPNATVDTGSPPVTFHAGDVVTYGPTPTLYRCLADSTGHAPDATPSEWMPLPAPIDDVRTTPGSPYASYGVQ